MGRRAQIALLIETSTTWGSGLIEGIADYAHANEDWHFLLGPRGKYERSSLPADFKGDGIIARITNQELADQLAALQVPTINVSWYEFAEPFIPRCTCDYRAVAEMAAKYFIDLGYRQFAYCSSFIRPDYVDRFGDAFVETLQNRTYRCHRHAANWRPDSLLPPASELERLTEWLRSLPKPVGLLTHDSVQARQVTEACEAAGLHVPHEVAVLGGEYDFLSCTISKPQLSSIDHGGQRVGHMAAQLLARWLRGEVPPREPVLIPPTRVISRQSTDTVAVSDALLAAALKFIREHCHEKIQVSDILREVPLSRRALEKEFQKWLNRSPAEEIRRIRVERAVQMLCDTSWSMPRIASAVGFALPELMTRAFHRELGMAPSEFRKRHLHWQRLSTKASSQKNAAAQGQGSAGV
ncbi:MAG: DNA-binding transcriptional regulator [Pirellulales bacterium]